MNDNHFHPYVIVDWSTGRELGRADDEGGARLARTCMIEENEAKDIRWTVQDDPQLSDS